MAPTRAACALLALMSFAAAVPSPAAASPDVAVSGIAAGTQHSPAVAITGTGATYVAYADRPTTTGTQDQLSLRVSLDQGATYVPVALPALPAGWYWRFDAHITYDATSDVLWLLSQAVKPGTGSEAAVYVVNGTPQPDGSVLWETPVSLFTASAGAIFIPVLGLATADDGGPAQVVFHETYSAAPGAVRHYRVPLSLTGVSGNVLQSGEPGVTFYGSQGIAAGADSKVYTVYSKGPISPVTDMAPLYARESADGGLTWSAEYYVTDVGYSADGPGVASFIGNPVTPLYARIDLFSPERRVLFWSGSIHLGPLYDPASLFVISSDFDVSTWNAWATMLPRENFFYEVHPIVVFAEDGYFYAGWHDFQPYVPDSLSRFTVAKLWNEGYSSSDVVPFASATFDWNTITSNLGFMGWQSGAAARGGRVAFAWGDHRDGSPDVHARSFRAEGVALSECAGDTVDATPGSTATFSFRIENRNELFPDDYNFGVTGTRTWTNGLDPDTVSIPPDGYADVTFDVAIPDTAANGLVTIFAYAYDHVRFPSCPMVLRISGSLVGMPPGTDPAVLSRGLALASPRPNPSDGLASLPFTLPAEARIELAIFDLKGRRIATPAEGRWTAGDHAVSWNGRTAEGSEVGAGVYFVRLTARAAGAEELHVRERRLVRLR